MTRPNQPKTQGAPLELTDEALDLAATVTPFDVGLARALWHQLAAPRLVELLDAAPEA